MFRTKKAQKKVWVTDPKRPIYTKPIAHPPSRILKHPPKFQDIENEKQQQDYDSVLRHFQNTELYPVKEKDCPKDEYKPLNDNEKAWLSRQCIQRYLRACDWKVDDVIKRLTCSIGWRREFGIAGGEFDTLTSETVKVEGETGKIIVFGYDKGGRPCLTLFNGRQNTKTSFRQIQHMIYLLERSVDFMPQGQDKLALCVDFKKYPEACTYEPKVPAVSVGKDVLHILQYHYPERLGRALFINIPWLVWGFLKICWPFVDPYTKKKVRFDEPFLNSIDADQLAVNHGGDVNFEYKHEDFWDELDRLAANKRRVVMDNYHRLGGGIGLSEWDLKQGVDDVDVGLDMPPEVNDTSSIENVSDESVKNAADSLSSGVSVKSSAKESTKSMKNVTLAAKERFSAADDTVDSVKATKNDVKAAKNTSKTTTPTIKSPVKETTNDISQLKDKREGDITHLQSHLKSDKDTFYDAAEKLNELSISTATKDN